MSGGSSCGCTQEGAGERGKVHTCLGGVHAGGPEERFKGGKLAR